MYSIGIYDLLENEWESTTELAKKALAEKRHQRKKELKDMGIWKEGIGIKEVVQKEVKFGYECRYSSVHKSEYAYAHKYKAPKGYHYDGYYGYSEQRIYESYSE